MGSLGSHGPQRTGRMCTWAKEGKISNGMCGEAPGKEGEWGLVAAEQVASLRHAGGGRHWGGRRVECAGRDGRPQRYREEGGGREGACASQTCLQEGIPECGSRQRQGKRGRRGQRWVCSRAVLVAWNVVARIEFLARLFNKDPVRKGWGLGWGRVAWLRLIRTGEQGWEGQG